MLAIKCLSCGRLAGSPAAPCEACKISFLSHELVAKIMVTTDREAILGTYTLNPETQEWVKEGVSLWEQPQAGLVKDQATGTREAPQAALTALAASHLLGSPDERAKHAPLWPRRGAPRGQDY